MTIDDTDHEPRPADDWWALHGKLPSIMDLPRDLFTASHMISQTADFQKRQCEDTYQICHQLGIRFQDFPHAQ
jgi:hypothetical protein